MSKIHYWKYNDVKNRTAWFRGYVKLYRGNKYAIVSCDKVRKNRKMALSDARKMEKKL